MSDCTRNLFRVIAVAKRKRMKTWFPAFLIAVVLILAQGVAGAEQAAKVPRIGYLGLDDPSSSIEYKGFQQGLRELGYIEGQNIIIESLFAFGNDWRLQELSAEMVRRNVNVIVTQADFGVMNMTYTVPIVMTYSGDPVAAGIVKSRERPGRNVTGIGGLATGLGGKWLELLKEVVPGVSRVGFLYFRNPERNSPMMKELEVVARSLRIELQPAEVRFERGGVGNAFKWATREQADGLIVSRGLSFNLDPTYIANLAIQRRVPAISWRANFAEAGGFMAYGANPVEQFRRAAYFVDKILRGADPAELPIELPKKFELVINLKTAKEIGITIPPRVLAWADKVIK
jgi:putative ABC transport system substrate-binding protein